MTSDDHSHSPNHAAESRLVPQSTSRKVDNDSQDFWAIRPTIAAQFLSDPFTRIPRSFEDCRVKHCNCWIHKGDTDVLNEDLDPNVEPGALSTGKSVGVDWSELMYTLLSYGAMLQDQVRIAAFTQALRAAVRPGAVVVDIGTGPGIMAVLACQLGASRVFAIEPDKVIQVAREVAASNGYADKIEFFETLSTRVELPVQADVIVSDLRGVLPLLDHHIPAIADARTRFLAPGGTLIARKDTIWAAPIEAPESFAELVDPWDRNTLDQDLSPARLRTLGSRRGVRHIKAGQLLGPPQLWATLDYATVKDPDVRSKLHWTIERDGVGHGILVWFEMDLADGISFSTGPGAPANSIYGSMFMPWTSPISLTAGHSVCVDLGAKLLEEGYFWRWTTQIESPEVPNKVLAKFDQSDLDGMVVSPSKLGKAASTYVPKLSEEARLHLRTLELMDGKASLEQIARQLIAEFPQRFPSWQQSLSYAATASRSYSQ